MILMNRQVLIFIFIGSLSTPTVPWSKSSLMKSYEAADSGYITSCEPTKKSKNANKPQRQERPFQEILTYRPIILATSRLWAENAFET